MDTHKNSAMIALLPSTVDWCKIELPHLTLVYAGEIEDLPQGTFNELAKDAANISMMSGPIGLKVLGVDVFGSEEKVDILRLMASPELLAMRSFVERWNKSEFPFRPHATVGPMGSASAIPPSYLGFDRIMVGWGNERLTFWLKR